LTAALALAACAPDTPETPSAAAPAELVPVDRAAKVALGLEHSTAADLALPRRANGGAPLCSTTCRMTGLWHASDGRSRPHQPPVC
jgi:hypothetical protein